jgi:hypothetical protein
MLPSGVAPNTGICNGIASRLQRDVDRLKSIDRSTAGSASGAF